MECSSLIACCDNKGLNKLASPLSRSMVQMGLQVNYYSLLIFCYVNLIHPPVTIIHKNLLFRFIQLMMYMVFIIDHIHHLMNESKLLIFAYNSDRRVYLLFTYYYCN